MEDLTLEKVVAITEPTKTLEGLRVRGEIKAPNYQRESINGTIRRIKDKSSKRFTCNRANNDYFIVKRIR